MKERKRERERERERESGLGREVRGPSPVHSPVLRSWSLFIILFRNAGQHKSLLFRDQPSHHIPIGPQYILIQAQVSPPPPFLSRCQSFSSFLLLSELSCELITIIDFLFRPLTPVLVAPITSTRKQVCRLSRFQRCGHCHGLAREEQVQ